MPNGANNPDQCRQCAVHHMLERFVNDLRVEHGTHRDVQAAMGKLCAERGAQILSLKEADERNSEDSTRIWQSINKLERIVYIAVGVGIAFQVALKVLWK